MRSNREDISVPRIEWQCRTWLTYLRLHRRVEIVRKQENILVTPKHLITDDDRQFVQDNKPILMAVLRLEEAIEAAFKPSGYVYLLQSGAYTKIGKTTNVDERVKALSIQLPFPVELIHVIECEDHHAVEKELHKQFAHYRLNGEWFELDSETIEELKQVTRL